MIENFSGKLGSGTYGPGCWNEAPGLDAHPILFPTFFHLVPLLCCFAFILLQPFFRTILHLYFPIWEILALSKARSLELIYWIICPSISEPITVAERQRGRERGRTQTDQAWVMCSTWSWRVMPATLNPQNWKREKGVTRRRWGGPVTQEREHECQAGILAVQNFCFLKDTCQETDKMQTSPSNWENKACKDGTISPF